MSSQQFSFRAYTDANGKQIMNITSPSSVPSSSATVNSQINSMKTKIQTSSSSDIISGLSDLQSSITNSNNSFKPKITQYLNSTYSDIFSKMNQALGETSTATSSTSTIPYGEYLGNSDFLSKVAQLRHLVTEYQNLTDSTTDSTAILQTKIPFTKTKFTSLRQSQYGSTFATTATSANATTSTTSTTSTAGATTSTTSATTSTGLSSSQISYLLNSLDVIKEIFNQSASQTTAMDSAPTTAKKTSGKVNSSGTVERKRKASLSSLSDGLSTISTDVSTLSSNDETLGLGLFRTAQAVTSNPMSNGVPQPRTNLNSIVPSPFTNLFPDDCTPPLTTATSTDTTSDTTQQTISNLNTLVLNNGRRSIRTRLQSRATTSTSNVPAADKSYIESGILTLIASLRQNIQKLSDEYTAKVQAGTATATDTTTYLANIQSQNAEIAKLEQELQTFRNGGKTRNPIYNTMAQVGTNIGNSALGPYIKGFFGGRGGNSGPSSKLKFLLKKILSGMNITTVTGLPESTTVSGVLSALDLTATTSNGVISVICNAIIQDNSFSLGYSISSSQFALFSDYFVSKLEPTLSTSSQKYNNYLVFIYVAMSLYMQTVLSNDNNIVTSQSSTTSTQAISNPMIALNPTTLTNFTTNILPIRSVSMDEDSQYIMSLGNGSTWISNLFGSDEVNSDTNEKVRMNKTLVSLLSQIDG